MHPPAQPPTHAHAHTHIARTHTRMHIHTRTHTHTRTHARARAHTHTHTHRCIQPPSGILGSPAAQNGRGTKAQSRPAGSSRRLANSTAGGRGAHEPSLPRQAQHLATQLQGTHACTHTRARASSGAQALTHACTHPYRYTHTRAHAYSHTHTCTLTLTYTHPHARAHRLAASWLTAREET